MPKQDPARLTKVSLSIPFGIGKAEWESDPSERRAAWSLYVELVTRVSVEGFTVPEGTEAEAMASLYSIFAVTRQILRDAGPDIAKKKDSLGAIALAVLNRGLRPFVTKWHSEIEQWKSRSQDAGTSSRWQKAESFRGELQKLQSELADYAKALAAIAGVDTSR
jgi:hypothetical protein